MTKTAVISPELLRQIIRFDGRDYFWNARPLEMFTNKARMQAWNSLHENKKVMSGGLSRHGYYRVGIFKRRYLAHRVIWAFHYGEWPSETIDHINGVRTDNRIGNLRAVSQAENQKNHRMRVDNKTGHTGVYWENRSKKWQARINLKGKLLNLGTFLNIEDAVLARKAAQKQLGFHENHGKKSTP